MKWSIPNNRWHMGLRGTRFFFWASKNFQGGSCGWVQRAHPYCDNSLLHRAYLKFVYLMSQWCTPVKKNTGSASDFSPRTRSLKVSYQHFVRLIPQFASIFPLQFFFQVLNHECRFKAPTNPTLFLKIIFKMLAKN